jgi:hypothetical protein
MGLWLAFSSEFFVSGSIVCESTISFFFFSQPLVIVYRIYYKLMKTTLEPQALMKSPKGKTLLLQASTSDSYVKVPTQIEWKDVKLPNK